VFKARKGSSGVTARAVQFFFEIEGPEKKRGVRGARGPIYTELFNFIIKLNASAPYPSGTLSTF
jgi:hypothetical protein